MYLCFHSATDRETPPYTIRLSVFDKENNRVEDRTVIASFPSDVAAISLPLEKVADISEFKVVAEASSPDLPGKKETVEIDYSCSSFEGAVSDFNISESADKNGTVVIEGTDSCGKISKGAGLIDSVKVTKNGELFKEEYNTTYENGELALSELPSGQYTIEMKKGDKVKVLSMSVSKKKSFDFYKIAAALVLIIGATVIYIRRKKPGTAKS